jgi:hypothetical protein
MGRTPAPRFARRLTSRASTTGCRVHPAHPRAGHARAVRRSYGARRQIRRRQTCRARCRPCRRSSGAIPTRRCTHRTPDARAAVVAAERWGKEAFQPVARRLSGPRSPAARRHGTPTSRGRSCRRFRSGIKVLAPGVNPRRAPAQPGDRRFAGAPISTPCSATSTRSTRSSPTACSTATGSTRPTCRSAHRQPADGHRGPAAADRVMPAAKLACRTNPAGTIPAAWLSEAATQPRASAPRPPASLRAAAGRRPRERRRLGTPTTTIRETQCEVVVAGRPLLHTDRQNRPNPPPSSPPLTRPAPPSRPTEPGAAKAAANGARSGQAAPARTNLSIR